MRVCELCGKALTKAEIDASHRSHSKCVAKMPLVKALIAECEELKRITGYDEILRRREAKRE